MQTFCVIVEHKRIRRWGNPRPTEGGLMTVDLNKRVSELTLGEFQDLEEVAADERQSFKDKRTPPEQIELHKKLTDATVADLITVLQTYIPSTRG
jgi:hypothetical protein